MINPTTRKHRSRSRATPNGRGTRITDNDIVGIFEPLSRHAQLTTKQIVAFDRRHPSTVRSRLTDLYHEEGEWLVRLGETVKLANALITDELHRLGRDAEGLLIARGLIPAEPWLRTSRVGGNSNAPSRIFRLAHDHMASHIALDIEIGAHDAQCSTFRNHVAIVRDAPLQTQSTPRPLRFLLPPILGVPKWIEPDAMFAIGNTFFAIEADTGSESIEAVIKPKIRAYREIFSSGTIHKQFGEHGMRFRVLFVTTSDKRMQNIMSAVASIASDGRSTMFAFACRPDLGTLVGAGAPDGRMFTLPWSRVGNEDMCIDLGAF